MIDRLDSISYQAVGTVARQTVTRQSVQESLNRDRQWQFYERTLGLMGKMVGDRCELGPRRKSAKAWLDNRQIPRCRSCVRKNPGLRQRGMLSCRWRHSELGRRAGPQKPDRWTTIPGAIQELDRTERLELPIQLKELPYSSEEPTPNAEKESARTLTHSVP